MPLSFSIDTDYEIEFADAGPVNGTPTGTLVSIKLLCNSFTIEDVIGRKIVGGGFGPDNKYRPGKRDVNCSFDADVAYSGGPVTAIVGHYGQVSYTPPGETEIVVLPLIIMGNEVTVNREDKAVQRIRLEGPADA